MKDRIFKYLLEAGRGVAAAQILSDALNTHSPNARSSDSALAGFLRQLPSSNGVYMMKDREGTILYVGKSRNLKRRVSSYFTPRALCYPKIARIHEQLYSIDVRRTDNEIEALLKNKEFHPFLFMAISMV